MSLCSSKISLSRTDLKKGVILPNKLTPGLAELMGIHVGDGNMLIYDRIKNGTRWVTYSISYFGNLHTDMDYFENYLTSLIYELFGIKAKILISKRDNTCILRVYSKGIVLFLKSLGILPGKKRGGIPLIIKDNKKLLPHFLRGLGDTDFSISLKNKYGKLYPVIAMGCANPVLTRDVSEALKMYGLNNYLALNIKCKDKRFPNKFYMKNFVEVNGKKNLKKWIKIIGFSNPARCTVIQELGSSL